MLTRREMLRLGLLGGGGALVAGVPLGRYAHAHAGSLARLRRRATVASPATTPFVDPLPVPPEPTPLPEPPPGFGVARDDCRLLLGARPTYYEILDEEGVVRMHRDLPPTRVWRYRDAFGPADSAYALGPTFKVRMAEDSGGGVGVRHRNVLPPGEFSFGIPRMTVHLHGGHQPAASDGFPDLDFGRGEFYDYCYPMLDTGFSSGKPEPCERPSTLWYHDHLLDFTAPNVYRGLAGFYLVFDEVDSGNEATGLRLPSGEFDVPLALQDKRFAADGSLVYDREEEDGFLGDRFLVNGVVQPFFLVKRRKYRFRVLNASNARWYRIYLTNDSGQTFPFDQIGTDGGLLAAPIRDIRSFQIALAERAEIVIDFSRFPTNQVLYLENRLEQDDGRGPDDVLSRGPRLLRFVVGEPFPDTSQVPPVLRPCAPISQAELSQATRRTFEFERSNSSWVINGEPVHINHPVARPVENKGEIWRLINGSGGWTHPIHLHLDFMRVLRRNGRLPPPNERDGMAKKDTIALGENESADVFIKYRDYPGRYVFHCHNLEHEDHAMMAVFDVMPAPVATTG